MTMTLLRARSALFAGAAAIAAAMISPTASAATPGPAIEAETMSLAGSSGQIFADAGASGGAGLLIWSNATATGYVATTSRTDRLTIRVRGDQCNGAPAMTVRIDGAKVLSTTVPTTSWGTLGASGSWSGGTHKITVAFTNDAKTAICDRNLRVDRAALASSTTSTTPITTTTNPLQGLTLWVDPNSNARQEIARRTGDTSSITQLTKIAEQPDARWLGDWVPTSTVASSVAATVGAATAAGAVAQLVLYAIPHRDCGSYSAGGFGTAADYAAWVKQVVVGLGSAKAVVVVEPDALALEGCLSSTDQSARHAMLRDALTALSTAPGAITYLDAGNSHWIGADVMAARLTDSGVASARGFSLNVSNFNATSDETAYGTTLSAKLGGARFVVDTSRNGLGPATGDLAWCNPSGRALGTRPTTSTGVSAADGFLWVKQIGESDGDCGRGEPSAGTWWADYAIGLASRAAY